MNDNSKSRLDDDRNSSYLPDLCQGESVLRLILVLELSAIVFALVGYRDFSGLFQDIAWYSMYIQWIGLASAASLCGLQRSTLIRSEVAETIAGFLVVAVIVILVSLLVVELGFRPQLSSHSVADVGGFLLRQVLISQILVGMVLRYFYLQQRNRRMLKTAEGAKLQALQARIRPHFLFNSLNTIASLTHDEPDLAEHAIENLAELFRASLKAESSVSLAREIEFTRDYIELERLRLDERLRVNWTIDADLDEVFLPALTLQPLVENAIYHGIEPAPGGGQVDIAVVCNGHELVFTIVNPISGQRLDAHREGNRMALENIRERLKLAFPNAAKIEHSPKNDLYTVKIIISLVGAQADPASH